MIRIALALTLTLGMAACSKPAPTAAPSATGEEAGPATKSAAIRRLDIGDVEAHVSLALRVSAESKTPEVNASEDWSRRKRLSLANTDVTQPFPESLWLALEIDSQHAFTTESVLLTTTIYVDDKEVGTFTDILGADAPNKTIIHKVDALAGLDVLPETMLARAEAKATLYLDKKPEDIDPETAERLPAWTADLPSNPMRINFIGDGS